MLIFKRIMVILLLAFVFIQLFRPHRNKSGDRTKDITTKYPASAEVKQILEIACNDCHSNTTKYPWYASIQPVAWWLAKHVKAGKKHLNFNEFISYKAYRRFHKMEEVEEVIDDKIMPMEAYINLHPKAELSAVQKEILINWSREVRDSIKSQYPADSLVPPQRK